MKKNKLFLLGLFVVFAAVLSLSLVSNTFAKYVSTGSSEDSARVAKWGVVINAEVYADDNLEANLTATENEIVASGTAPDLLAPGTGVKFASVTINGTPEVAVRVTYTATLELTGWTWDDDDDLGTPEVEYMPLVFVINGNAYSYAGVGAANIDAFEDKIEEIIAAYSEQYAAGLDLLTENAGNLTVSCYWEYAGNDAADTAFGDKAANSTAPKVDLTINCTVTQVE